MVSIDASTPAFAAGSNDPWVTASFTPPNDSLLVVVVVGDWFGGTPTITPTSTSLTFTSQGKFGAINNGVIEIFTAPVGSNGGTARTVSVTTSISSDVGGAKVYVVTDFYAADPVEAVGTNTGSPSGTNNFTPTVLTTFTDGCWTFGGAVNWVGGSLASTSTDVFEEFNDADLSVMVARKSAATSPAGAVTLNFDQVAGGTPVWTYGAIAIRPSTFVPPPVQVVSQGAAVSGTTSITTAAYGAGWAAGDLIVYTVASNHSTTESTEPTVSGFTNRGTLNGGGGTQGTGTGNRRLTFFTKTAAGGDDTTPTISLSGGNVMVAASTVLRADPGYTWQTPVSAFGAETTAGTGWTQAMTSDPGMDVDDVLLLACSVRDSSDTSAESLTATGLTVGSVAERTDSSSETGNDIALHVSTTTVLGGPNSATPTRTATHSTSETGVMGILRIRAVSGNASVSATTVSGAATIPAPTVVAQAHATATPSTVSATATVGAAAVRLFRYIADTAGTGTGQYFVDAAGDPILVRGYVLWGLPTNAGRWNAGDWELDLESAVAALEGMGVNVLYTAPLGNTQNGANNNLGLTHDGVAPFTGGDPATFNNTFWARIDYLLDLCEAAGITVFFNFAYSDDLDNAALADFTTGDFTDYGTSLAARYKTRPNLVWMAGGDYFDTFNTALTAVKTAIRAEGDTHLFGIQNYPETTSRKDIENNATQNTGTDNSEFNFVYTYNTTYWGIEFAYSESSPLAAMWGDGHFDQDTTADRKIMRDLTWWAFSSGARGIIHGSEATWEWGSGALAALDSETYSSTDMGGIWDLFTSFENWQLLVPDADSSFVTAGRGTKSDYVTSGGGGGGEYNSADTQSPYVTAGITADGTLAVVYFPVDQTITVDDNELAGGYTVRWVDPISGDSTPETPAGTYSPTGSNSLGGADWLLVFEATADPDADVTPSTVSGSTSITTPTVRLSKTATPSTVVATAAVGAPTVRLSAAITPSVVTATATVGAPTVRAGATVSPAAVAASTSIPAPTIHAGAVVTATTVSGVATVGVAAVQTGNSATATPSVVAGTATVGTPALLTDQTVSASTVAATATIPAPSVQAGANASVSATTVAGAAAIPAPAVQAGTSTSPATVSGSTSVPSPTVQAGATVTPSLVAGTTSIPAPGVSAGGSATASPQTVAAVTAVPTPSLSTSSRVNPTVVAGLAALPAPAIVSGTGSTATALVVSGSTTIAVPTIRLGAAISRPTVAGAASIPTPTMHTSVLVPAFSVAAVATIPNPVPVSITPGSASSAVGARPTSRGAHGIEAAAGAGDEYGVASSGGTASVPHSTGGV